MYILHTPELQINHLPSGQAQKQLGKLRYFRKGTKKMKLLAFLGNIFINKQFVMCSSKL